MRAIYFWAVLHAVFFLGIGCSDRLDSPDYSERIRAVRALGAAKDTSGAVQTLGRVLREDPDSMVRSAAAATLGKLPSPQAVTLLLEKAASTDEVLVRSDAIHALGTRGDPSAIPGLIEQFRLRGSSDDRYLHAAASLALADIGHPAVEPLMEVGLRDSEAIEVREYAFRTLEFIGDESVRERVSARLGDPKIGYIAEKLIEALDERRTQSPP